MPDSLLSPEEKQKLRQVVGYLVELAKEIKPPKDARSRLKGLLEVLGNGFILLAFGTLFTAILVPVYRQYLDERNHRQEAISECLTKFLLASNLIYEEFSVVTPLQTKVPLSKEDYAQALIDHGKVRARRYDAFATVQALTPVFLQRERSKSIPQEIDKYMVSVNQVSRRISGLVRAMYCAGGNCADEEDPTLNEPLRWHEIYAEVQQALIDLQTEMGTGELSVAQHIAGELTEGWFTTSVRSE